MNLIRPEAHDTLLPPGGFYFGNAATRISTLLGSCVAITLWHPKRKLGGMCHFILPAPAELEPRRQDGRYAGDAIALFMRQLQANGTHPCEYEAKLFGGGRMFSQHQPRLPSKVDDVGLRNVASARQLLHNHGFRIKAEQVAGQGHRNIIFDLSNGDVWVKHVAKVAI